MCCRGNTEYVLVENYCFRKACKWTVLETTNDKLYEIFMASKPHIVVF
jgi:hypothetical protein